MPLFEFNCRECKADFEELVNSGKQANVACPTCGSKQVTRKMSTFSGRMGQGKSEAPAGGCATGSCCMGGMCN